MKRRRNQPKNVELVTVAYPKGETLLNRKRLQVKLIRNYDGSFIVALEFGLDRDVRNQTDENVDSFCIHLKDLANKAKERHMHSGEAVLVIPES